MNRANFIDILHNPELVAAKTIDSIKEILDEYPFFQAGRMLLLKNMHKLDHIRYNSELKHSAVYIPDRNKLFALLNSTAQADQTIGPDVTEEKESDDLSVQQSVKPAEQDIEKPRDKARTISDNYLDASNDFIDEEGNSFNFSFSLDKGRKDKEENQELDDIVLPAADLLDYETASSTGYMLPKIEEISNVDPNENRSFSDWLHIMRYSSPQLDEEKVEKKAGGMDLIDSFLKKEPKIIPSVSKKKEVVDLSEEEEDNQDDILSETLADIYIKQGYKDKALAIFEKLHLKYPEKSVYFARRINELKEN
jgi:hypothetical protein